MNSRAGIEPLQSFIITEKAPTVKALVGAFNKEKALAGSFSVIVKPTDHLQH